MKVFSIILILGLISLCSCGKYPLTKAEWIQYAYDSESGLLQSKEINGVRYSAFMKPIQLRYLTSEKENINPKSYEEFCENEGSYLLIDYQIEYIRNGDNDISQLSAPIVSQDEILLVTSDKRIPCSVFHQEPNAFNSKTRMALGFDTDGVALENGFQIEFENRFLNGGNVVFAYNKEKLENVPPIQF